MATKLIKDNISFKDKSVDMPEVHSGLWARTEVIGGYGDFINVPGTGKTTLGEVCFDTHNMVEIGGVSYVMQQLFGVEETQITIPTLYTQSGIGAVNTNPPTETYLTPNGAVKIQYRYGHLVQLFGIGITGTGESDITDYKPDYRETTIDILRATRDGKTLRGTMLPFRYLGKDTALSALDRKKYFGKKADPDNDGFIGYYLKAFNQTPVIKHVWKTGEEVDEENLVSSSDVWDTAIGVNAVESFTEILLTISKKDVKEWFIHLEQEDRTRINTIALFNGRYTKDASNPADYGDYEDVRLFSKLCIPTEYLSLSKDLNIIYRVYGS